jgi:cytoskeletal protein CcmA (bactofilin family)
MMYRVASLRAVWPSQSAIDRASGFSVLADRARIGTNSLMREERGRLVGDVTVSEPVELWGSVAGDVTVVDGGKFYVRGAIYGNLIIEDGGRVHVFGNVQGNVTVRDGAKVIVSGVVGGNVLNSGGRLVVEAIAKVTGKIKTKSGGETRLEGPNRNKE